MVAAVPDTVAERLAVRFVRALLSAGQQLEQVFFYHDGVQVLSDASAAERWSKLLAARPGSLVACAAAIERRDLAVATNAAGDFQLAGLAQWLDASLRADRVVRFGPTDD